MVNIPLFIGLTHIGQVYSYCWSQKINSAAVFDFNLNNLEKFKKKKFTIEEPELNKVKKISNIKILNSEKEINKYKVIFLTLDTPLDLKSGKPKVYLIEKYFKKISKIKFNKKIKLIVTSQIPVGFTKKLKNKYPNKKIDVLYMVDTLKMGEAQKRFLFPSQLIFGGQNSNLKFLKRFFKKFRCKKYLFSYEEAELIKISINIFLFFSVSYANLMDEYSRDKSLNFSRILNVLKNDKRIGKNAYLNPSISISGGHLERDYFYLVNTKNSLIKKSMNNLMNINSYRKTNLFASKFQKLKKKIKILIIGLSYKKESFSIVNSIFFELLKNKKLEIFYYDDKYKDIKNKYFKKIDKLKNLNDFKYIIFNYGSNKTIQQINKNTKNNNNLKIINLSTERKKIFKENNIEYFDKENINFA
ncbi:MAG: hypothetical protein CBC82_07555 [Cellvibrionales bacterium TMED122]|nr:MAG: hypothetical protein CBC82_07555 [Cellvibrionales bacterium TMED122]